MGDGGTASGSSFTVPSSSDFASPISSVLSPAQSTQTTLFSEASAVDRDSGVVCMVALVLGIAL